MKTLEIASSPTATTATEGRLVSIDVLRGVAVLLVMLSHLPFSMIVTGSEPDSVYPAAPFEDITEFGRYGVHLFLIISGFSIHMRWARKADVTRSIDWLGFWKRRLRRLYPPYLVVLVLSLTGLAVVVRLSGVAGAAPAPGGWLGYDENGQLLVDLILLLLLMQNLNGASIRVGNNPFWSLALEEQLYILYIPLLHLRRRYGWTSALIITAVVTIAWRLLGAILFEEPPGFWFLFGLAFWLPWSLGAMCAEYYNRHIIIPPWTFSTGVIVLTVAGGVLLNYPQWVSFPPRAFTWAADLLVSLAFFGLIVQAVSFERKGGFKSKVWKPLANVGLWSYGIYLVHNPVFIASKRLALFLDMPLLGVLLFRFSAGLVAGYVFFRFIEVPCIRWARQAKVKMPVRLRGHN